MSGIAVRTSLAKAKPRTDARWFVLRRDNRRRWIPAFAGMTENVPRANCRHSRESGNPPAKAITDAVSRGSWPAPAKVNLFLHVLERRADGYHDLQTLFQFLDLCDELTFTPNREGRIRRLGSAFDWPEDRDLAICAARLLRDSANVSQGVDITLHKRIPAGSGLGGGSSDAATVLVALDSIWNLRSGVGRLAELGRRLGADVPVFVRGRAAWGEGVGDRLRPVHLEEPHYVVVTPPCRVPTAEIFRALALTRNRAPLKMSDFPFGGRPENARAPSIPALLECSANDCEEVTRKRYPLVGQALERLSRFGRPRMTGTGASVFMPLANESEGTKILLDLPPGWQGFICRGLNRSPLITRADMA